MPDLEKHEMRRVFIYPVIAILISACAAPTGNGQRSAAATAAVTPTEAATPTRSVTPVPPALILADFPLARGAVWKYSGEISYGDPNDYTRLLTWSGSITDKVIDEKTLPDGAIVFALQEDLEPTPPKGRVWRESGSFEYRVSGDGIFESGLKIYQWPLSDHLSWPAFSGFGYSMNASYTGTVDTPYGRLKNCYVLSIVTNPDTSAYTLCRGIGFVEHSYAHHGTPQVEHFTLVSYTPGQ